MVNVRAGCTIGACGASGERSSVARGTSFNRGGEEEIGAHGGGRDYGRVLEEDGTIASGEEESRMTGKTTVVAMSTSGATG